MATLLVLVLEEVVPLIDVRCIADHLSEVMRPLAMYPATPACPTCGAATTQIHLPKSTAYTLDPVVVFRAPDGSFRFPGDANGLSAANYQRQGYDRIELRNAADVRRFESHMNKRELSRAHRRVERSQQMREARESTNRAELRRLMSQMSQHGRDVARAAMRRNDNQPRERAKESGFHVQAYSYDHSNREDSRDAQGRRRRD